MKEIKKIPILKVTRAYISYNGDYWVEIPKKYIRENSIGIPPQTEVITKEFDCFDYECGECVGKPENSNIERDERIEKYIEKKEDTLSKLKLECS